jgi:phosphoglycolate phosphatase
MPFRAILFDLDGTLLDTLVDIADAANAVLADRKLPTHSYDDFRYLVGDGVRVLFERALPAGTGSEEVAECVACFQQAYDQSWNRTSRPYAGIEPLLDELVRRDLALTVLSNKPDHFTQLCVRQYFPRWPWAAIAGQRSDIARKPDPAGALRIAAELHLAPAEILYLGDTSTDMRTAVSAGMYPVGCLWGFREEAELRASGAQAIIARPEELLGLL